MWIVFLGFLEMISTILVIDVIKKLNIAVIVHLLILVMLVINQLQIWTHTELVQIVTPIMDGLRIKKLKCVNATIT